MNSSKQRYSMPNTPMRGPRFHFWALKLFGLALVLQLSAASAFAIAEICGNGLDDDGVGGDLACPEPDKDNDGYASSGGVNVDCDDSDYKIYPGVYTAKGCSSGLTRKCNSDGSFTSCSTSVVCEASAGGSCKYIDCGAGSDSSGNGSFASPWRSLKMVGDYESSGLKPSGAHQLHAGDVVYIKGSGTCSDWYDVGPSLSNVMLYVQTSGTASAPITIKRYPGATAVLDSPFTSSSLGYMIQVAGASYVKLEDLDLTDSYGVMIYLTNSTNVEVARVRCHDSRGTYTNNISCINATHAQDHYIHHNEIFNIYDADTPGGENISLIVYFAGENNRFEYNRLYYTNSPDYGGPIRGRCLKYKHPSATGAALVFGNQFWNCNAIAVTNSTNGMVVRQNLIVDTGPASLGGFAYHCGDVGGGAYCRNIVIENNTIINSRALQMYSASGAGLGSTVFRRNVVVDNATGYGSENGFFRVERYGNASVLSNYSSVNALRPSENCYYNASATLRFDYFGDSGLSGGGFVDFAGWKSLGFDSSSYNENPQLTSTYRAQSSHCSTFGWTGAFSSSRPAAPTGLSVTLVP